MCLIIDTNCIGKLIRGHDDMRPVMEWLMGNDEKGKKKKPRGNLTFSKTPKMEKEYFGRTASGKFQKLLKELEVIMPPKVVPPEDVKAALHGLNYPLVSDDPHIVGLAIASGCRMLVSNDKNLHTDFKAVTKRKGRGGQKGRVYQYKDQCDMLDSYSCS